MFNPDSLEKQEGWPEANSEGKQINPLQAHELERIAMTSHNEFDGARVASLLAWNRDLWEGVVIDRIQEYCARPEYSAFGSLIKLRDIDSGLWNVDTLYILPARGREAKLEQLALGWFVADEVGFLDKKTSAGMMGASMRTKVLRVWWD